MWTDGCYRFPDEAAFLAACDAAGWPRDKDGKPWPESVVLDIIGPGVEPPQIVDGVAVPGDTSPGWYVNASWFTGATIPAEWTAAEVVPEAPLRMFAARDQAARADQFKADFAALKRRRANDPKLVSRIRAIAGPRPS
jgi:hypothetical protein